MMDPLFLHEVALERGMTVSELLHGRGTPVSIHELCVEIPLFISYRNRQAKKQAEEQEKASRGGLR